MELTKPIEHLPIGLTYLTSYNFYLRNLEVGFDDHEKKVNRTPEDFYFNVSRFDIKNKPSILLKVGLSSTMVRNLILLLLAFFLLQCDSNRPSSLRIALFTINATPPLGSPVAYAYTRSIQDSLYAKGIVILSDQKPIVICAVDWIGIANEGLEIWRRRLAKAAGTTEARVAIHALHQHDGVRGDFTTASVLEQYGLGGWRYDTDFIYATIDRSAAAIKNAIVDAKEVTHVGYGQAKVEKVASNRRILGPDGKVSIIRWSKTSDSAAIAAPEGLIDPWLRSVSFWQHDVPLVNLNYYTTHPMSHYGQGDVSSDFVGIAREARQHQLGISQIYFSGAGGNITAGKYNDGSPERRYILADRVEQAMTQAWETSTKIPITGKDLKWRTSTVLLPLGEHLIRSDLVDQLESSDTDSLQKFTAAKHLAWLNRTEQGHSVTVSALNLKNIWLLHLPGELFVEYQLAAQRLRSDDFVCTAAYGEYGPGYVCTEIAYNQGGYESSNRASRVSPQVESVLMQSIQEVLMP